MTQAERASVDGAADVTPVPARLDPLRRRLGAVAEHRRPAWADMYDGFQHAALATPLRHPDDLRRRRGARPQQRRTARRSSRTTSASAPPATRRWCSRSAGPPPRRSPAPASTGTSRRACAWPATTAGAAPTSRSARRRSCRRRWPRIITGLQGTTLGGPASVLATAKHYLGDGGTTGGIDQGNTQLTEAELRAIHLPPFQEAVRRGVGSVMVSYSQLERREDARQPVPHHRRPQGRAGLQRLRRLRLGRHRPDRRRRPASPRPRCATAINAGIDMVMVPTDWQQLHHDLLRSEVQAGRVPMARIDDAIRRILTKKFELGLFEHPFDRPHATPSTVGSAAHRALARQAVRESQVLLKNDGDVLPLAKTGGKIFVAGKNADDIGNQCGGWTITWQGGSGAITAGHHDPAGHPRHASAPATTVDLQRRRRRHRQLATGVAIAVRRRDARTPRAQGDRPARWASTPPTCSTLATLRGVRRPGRGRAGLRPAAGHRRAAAGLERRWSPPGCPAPRAHGVADVLFGDYAPTGKLPMTWMQQRRPAADQRRRRQDAAVPVRLRARPTRPRPTPRARTRRSQAEASTPSPVPRTRPRTDTGGGQDVGHIAPGRLARLRPRLRYQLAGLGHHPARVRGHRQRHRSSTGWTARPGRSSPPSPVSPTGGWQTWQSVTAT